MGMFAANQINSSAMPVALPLFRINILIHKICTRSTLGQIHWEHDVVYVCVRKWAWMVSLHRKDGYTWMIFQSDGSHVHIAHYSSHNLGAILWPENSQPQTSIYSCVRKQVCDANLAALRCYQKDCCCNWLLVLLTLFACVCDYLTMLACQIDHHLVRPHSAQLLPPTQAKQTSQQIAIINVVSCNWPRACKSHSCRYVNAS